MHVPSSSLTFFPTCAPCGVRVDGQPRNTVGQHGYILVFLQPCGLRGDGWGARSVPPRWAEGSGCSHGVWRGNTLGNAAVRSLLPLREQRALGGDQLAHVHDVVTGALHGSAEVVEAIRAQERHGLGGPPAPHHERLPVTHIYSFRREAVA